MVSDLLSLYNYRVTEVPEYYTSDCCTRIVLESLVFPFLSIIAVKNSSTPHPS